MRYYLTIDQTCSCGKVAEFCWEESGRESWKAAYCPKHGKIYPYRGKEEVCYSCGKKISGKDLVWGKLAEDSKTTIRPPFHKGCWAGLI